MGPSPRHPLALLVLQALILASCAKSGPANSNLFREYLGAEFKDVKFSDVPVNSGVEFHYILSFAIDYTSDPSSTPAPTNGEFNVFWDTGNLSPSAVAAIKSKHPNVKVALSLGGDSVGDGESAFFDPSSPETWISNAVSSLTQIIQEYNLDGIDIDYEHFKTDPDTFAHCVGQLISTLKRNGVVSFASIAPFDDDEVQSHYMALWKGYGQIIDYVNFQFYAYEAGTTVEQFLRYFEEQSGNYGGGKVLPSFISDGSGGLAPDGGFFTACSRLKSEGKLYGIFVWCADDSKGLGFKYEKQSQSLIAISH